MYEHWYAWIATAAVPIVVAIGLMVLLRRLRGWRRIAVGLMSGIALILALLLGVPGGYFFWAQHRFAPPPLTRQVVPGVTYERRVHAAPRPMVVHVLRVDLATPGLTFVTSPRSPVGDYSLRADTTRGFATTFDCDTAINANYFRPFRSNAPWDYYPHVGDGCDVLGLAQSNGDRYGSVPWRAGVVYLGPGGRVAIDEPLADVDNADVQIIAGNGLLVRDGKVAGPLATDELAVKPYPRAALGLNRDRTRMTWVVIDGKQIGYSEGATLAEFADMLVALGIDQAVRLDEGGSATLVGRPEGGGPPAVLNVPSNTRIIGRERPVANSLGLRVRAAQP